MSAVFISAGWPYLYDIPGLHNCVPMLFADVAARFARLQGHEVFFLCGADEYGARTEYVARANNIAPQELLDSKFEATIPLLKKLNLSFDYFGRTTDPVHKKFVQDFIDTLIKKEAIITEIQKVAWCTSCKHHLPDRFLEGICPYCSGKTYGNQCNNKKSCAKLVEADRVINSHCAVCNGAVEWREESHLFFKMDNQTPSVCISRDTAWGILYSADTAKTIYSWVDSLLAKVSMVTKFGAETVEKFWKNSEARHMFFQGADGTPFYGQLFPALLSTSDKGYQTNHWQLLPNEMFFYEDSVCSKSTGSGIWLGEALATLPGDFWRFYIFQAHANMEIGAEPNVNFRWPLFCEAVNTFLIRGLEAAVKAGSGENGVEIEKKAYTLLENAQYGPAFKLLMNGIIQNPSAEKTERLSPLLRCFLPSVGEQLGYKKNPLRMAPLYAPEVQMDYQDKVDERRANRGLSEEIVDARASILCVCPGDLKEQ